MLVIPFRYDVVSYSVFVVLSDENLTRLREYDPAEVTVDKLGPPWASMRLKDVIIAYATARELEALTHLRTDGEVRRALMDLSRGFKFRPDRGDSDAPYRSVRG